MSIGTEKLMKLTALVIVVLFLGSAIPLFPGSNEDQETISLVSDQTSREQDADVGSPQVAAFHDLNGWFTENRGQFENPKVQFAYVGSDISVGFMESGYLIRFTGDTDLCWLVEVEFQNSNQVFPSGREQLEHKSNYFLGNDPADWVSSVPNYHELRYKDLYSGIDLIFTITQGGLKYEFLVSQRADPREICWNYQGAESISLDDRGRFHLTTPAGDLVEEAPYSYQLVNGAEQEVASSYQLHLGRLSFLIDDYDHALPLVIDPLIYSTFIGGSDSELSTDVALDQEGNVCVVGLTESTNFPATSGAFERSHNAASDVFVCKFNSDLSELLFATYLGSNSLDSGRAIAIDKDNDIYVTGGVWGSNFPTTNGCYDSKWRDRYDVFVSKLSSDGSKLLFSTYIGEEDDDWGTDLAVDEYGNVFVTGYSESSTFPTTAGSLDESHNGRADAFALKLKKDGSSLIYSTFIGTSGEERGTALWLDSYYNLYITGKTSSSAFPTTSGSYDEEYNGGDSDVFMLKLDQYGANLEYSTFLGGSNADVGHGLFLDSGDNVYLTGYTGSSNFPTTPGCYDDEYNGGGDIFIAKLDSEVENLLMSTFVGGDKRDESTVVVQGPDKDLYIGGITLSKNFPATAGSHSESHGGGSEDGFVLKLDPTNSELVYASYLGDESHDEVYSLCLDPDGEVYLAGWTHSSDFPTTEKAYDRTMSDSDGFVTKMSLTTIYANIESVSPNPAVLGEDIVFTGKGLNDAGTIIEYSWRSNLDGELYSGEDAEFTRSSLTEGEHLIYFKVKGDDEAWSEESSITLPVFEQPSASITTLSPNPVTVGEEVTFKGSGSGGSGNIVAYSWHSSVVTEFYNGEESEIHYSALERGSHVISFRVQDTNGVWSEAVKETLVVRRVPRALIDSITPNPGGVTDTIVFEGHGAADGPIESYLWKLKNDGGSEVHSNDKANFQLSSLQEGVYTVTFKVKDDIGTWSPEVSETLVVGNVPTAEILAPTATQAIFNESVRFSALGTGEGSITAYAWSSSLDGEFYNGPLSEVTHSELSLGIHTIFLKVQEDDKLWSKIVNMTVVIHERPNASIESITPNPVVFRESRVEFIGNGSDDGNISRYVWKSSLDGEIYNGTEMSFNNTGLSPGTHVIHFKVQDDQGVWSREMIQNLFVNRKPTAAIDLIKPTSPVVNSTIHFRGNGSDDGDIVLYSWRSDVDGELYNGSELEFNHPGLPLGVRTVYLKVKDHHGVWSDEASVSLVVKEKEEEEPFILLQTLGPLPIVGYLGVVVILLVVMMVAKKKSGERDSIQPPVSPAFHQVSVPSVPPLPPAPLPPFPGPMSQPFQQSPQPQQPLPGPMTTPPAPGFQQAQQSLPGPVPQRPVPTFQQVPSTYSESTPSCPELPDMGSESTNALNPPPEPLQPSPQPVSSTPVFQAGPQEQASQQVTSQTGRQLPQKVKCPKCSAAIVVDSTKIRADGKVAIQCFNCGTTGSL